MSEADINYENPFPREYGDLTPISEALKRPLNPKEIRRIADTYGNSGIEIVESNNPTARTTINSKGQIKSEIPSIGPFGPDVTTVHEFVHIEQILRAIKSGATTESLKKVGERETAVAEIFAREAEIQYIDQLSFRERWRRSYRERRNEARRAIKDWYKKIPNDTQISNDEKLNPYKKESS